MSQRGGAATNVEQTILIADGADGRNYYCLYPRHPCNLWLKNLARGIPRGVTRILNSVIQWPSKGFRNGQESSLNDTNEAAGAQRLRSARTWIAHAATPRQEFFHPVRLCHFPSRSKPDLRPCRWPAALCNRGSSRSRNRSPFSWSENEDEERERPDK